MALKPRHGDLYAVCVVAAAAVLVTLPGISPVWARAMVGLPLALLLPGYALTALLPAGALGRSERLLFSLALSIGVSILGGLALNWTPWGLTARAWAVLLGGLTIGAAAAALRRWPPSVGRPLARHALRPGPVIGQALLLALAVGVAAGAASVARSGAALQPRESYTQLWLVPDGGGDAGTVRVGLRSDEPADVTYRLLVADGGAIIREWPAIQLAPGETWEASLDLAATHGAGHIVHAMLYRHDLPGESYRHVTLQRPGEAAGP